MTIESLPTFTRPARQRWETIPADIRQRLLSNVWCGHCHHETTITNFSGTIKGGDLLLAGQCAVCHGDVVRVIEGVSLSKWVAEKVQHGARASWPASVRELAGKWADFPSAEDLRNGAGTDIVRGKL